MSTSFDKLCTVRSRLADDIVAFCDAVIAKLDTTGYSFNNKGTTAPIRISTTVIDARVFTREKESGKEPQMDGRDGEPMPTPHERALAELNEIIQFATEKKTIPWSRVFAGVKPGRPLVVIGAPGGGKTTLSCHSVLQRLDAVGKALQNHTALPEETFPALWTTCTSLAECTDATEDVTALVINAAFHALGLPPESKARSPRVRDWLRIRIESGECPLVIDSLDELEEKNREAFQHRAPRLLDLASPVVLTCRVVEWTQRRALAGWESKEEGPFELASLDAHEQRLFMERFFNEGIKRPEKLAGMRKVLSSNQALRRTCESPILLMFSCLLHGENALEGATRRTDLYNLIRRRLFLGEWREIHYTPSWVDGKDLEDDVTDWLAEIALGLFRDRPETKMFSSDQWRIAASSPEASKAAVQLPADITPRALLKDLERCGFLVFAGRSAQDRSLYSFTHRSFLACLAGRALSRRDPLVYQREVIEHLWFQPAWEDVILFLAGHLDEAGADGLLNAIRKEPEDIFRERLRWEWRIAGEVVSLPPKWGEVWAISVAELVETTCKTTDSRGSDGTGGDKIRVVAIRQKTSALFSALLDKIRAAAIREAAIRAAAIKQRSSALFSALGDATRTTPNYVEKLLQHLNPECEPERYVRCSAANALGKIGDARAEENLLRSRNPEHESDYLVRHRSSIALWNVGGKQALGEILWSLDLKHQPVPKERCLAVNTLGKILGRIGDARAVDRLIESLDPEHEPDVIVRSCVACALGKSGDRRAVDGLFKCLDTDHERVCTHAAEALAKIGDARALDPSALDELLHSLVPNRELDWFKRRYSASALRKLEHALATTKQVQSKEHERAHMLDGSIEEILKSGNTKQIVTWLRRGLVLKNDRTGIYSAMFLGKVYWSYKSRIPFLLRKYKLHDRLWDWLIPFDR